MVEQNLTIENAEILFPNFSGEPGKYNPAGCRNFCIKIDREVADDLKELGWNIRVLHPKNEDDLPQPYLQVAVKFGNYPPKIVLISSSGKTVLNENNVGLLDWAEIKNADVIIRPYNYEANGRLGTKAYLKALYVTIQEDEFESKYYDVPDSAANSVFQ